jgi:hypothetical protein
MQNDLEMSREQIELHRNELVKLHEHLFEQEQIRTKIEYEKATSQETCEQLQRDIIDRDRTQKAIDKLVDDYRQQADNEKKLRSSK